MTTSSTLSEIEKSFQSFNSSITSIEKAYGRISRQIDEYENQENIPRDYLTEMAGNLAHEIRNPLGGIANLVELLSQNPQTGHSRSIDGILDGVRRIDQIVENLIIFSRPVVLKTVECNFADIIEHAVESVKNRIETDAIKYQFDFINPHRELYVKLDPALMLQTLQNIMMNAVESMRDGGKIKLELQEVDENADLVVKDNGAGLREVSNEKPFYPFYTTKTNGMGLGLPTARLIVEKHKGKIWIDETGKSGIDVRLRVPKK